MKKQGLIDNWIELNEYFYDLVATKTFIRISLLIILSIPHRTDDLRDIFVCFWHKKGRDHGTHRTSTLKMYFLSS